LLEQIAGSLDAARRLTSRTPAWDCLDRDIDGKPVLI
jgi:hypothetical protein